MTLCFWMQLPQLHTSANLSKLLQTAPRVWLLKTMNKMPSCVAFSNFGANFRQIPTQISLSCEPFAQPGTKWRAGVDQERDGRLKEFYPSSSLTSFERNSTTCWRYSATWMPRNWWQNSKKIVESSRQWTINKTTTHLPYPTTLHLLVGARPWTVATGPMDMLMDIQTDIRMGTFTVMAMSTASPPQKAHPDLRIVSSLTKPQTEQPEMGWRGAWSLRPSLQMDFVRMDI